MSITSCNFKSSHLVVKQNFERGSLICEVVFPGKFPFKCDTKSHRLPWFRVGAGRRNEAVVGGIWQIVDLAAGKNFAGIIHFYENTVISFETFRLWNTGLETPSLGNLLLCQMSKPLYPLLSALMLGTGRWKTWLSAYGGNDTTYKPAAHLWSGVGLGL